MPAISFQSEFLDSLLSGEKQQTTRPVPPDPPKRPRFKVGDVAHVYNQQRSMIDKKPLRRLTPGGKEILPALRRLREWPMYYHGYESNWTYYYAHFLGKVEITEVYDILPSTLSGNELEVWAMRDGFDCWGDAFMWFESRYDDDWMEDMFTVCRWDGWQERYFEPYEVIR